MSDEPRILSMEQEELLMNSNLDLGALAAYAFMFNFHEAYSLSHKLCVQLYDVNECHQFVSDEVRILCIMFNVSNTFAPLYVKSSGIHLDTVGVTQIASMHVSPHLPLYSTFNKNIIIYFIFDIRHKCKDGRMLEVSVYIGMAPGRLKNYTKLVRFSPRYILVNQLERPLHLW